ncbi:MAG: hypothetical protein ACTHJR_10995 [Sphingomonas sp.]|uniref:hypothetical protein n=1 Tax=Sphingomonas sp. TaxID=28214 RepID=UPI003F7DD198
MLTRISGQLIIRDQGLVVDQRRVLMVIGLVGVPPEIAKAYAETKQYTVLGRYADEALTLSQIDSGSWPHDTKIGLSADQFLTSSIWRI